MGGSYPSIGGLYRRYELIYLAAGERDVFRVRTNYRKGEEIYLHRTTVTPAESRGRFVEYLNAINSHGG